MGYYPQESLYKPYKYHGYTVRGTPHCPLIFVSTFEGLPNTRYVFSHGGRFSFFQRLLRVKVLGGSSHLVNLIAGVVYTHYKDSQKKVGMNIIQYKELIDPSTYDSYALGIQSPPENGFMKPK